MILEILGTLLVGFVLLTFCIAIFAFCVVIWLMLFKGVKELWENGFD